jgi:hypothetical protein
VEGEITSQEKRHLKQANKKKIIRNCQPNKIENNEEAYEEGGSPT